MTILEREQNDHLFKAPTYVGSQLKLNVIDQQYQPPFVKNVHVRATTWMCGTTKIIHTE